MREVRDESPAGGRDWGYRTPIDSRFVLMAPLPSHRSVERSPHRQSLSTAFLKCGDACFHTVTRCRCLSRHFRYVTVISKSSTKLHRRSYRRRGQTPDGRLSQPRRSPHPAFQGKRWQGTRRFGASRPGCLAQRIHRHRPDRRGTKDAPLPRRRGQTQGESLTSRAAQRRGHFRRSVPRL